MLKLHNQDVIVYNYFLEKLHWFEKYSKYNA